MDRRAFMSLIGAMAATAAGRAAAARPPNARNVVLVHGLFADGSSWSEVIPRLQGHGLNVTSVQNPLTTLDEALAETQRVLDRQVGPTVLAGHSFSGMIVTEAGIHPKVTALVYVPARAPDAGEDYSALAKKFPTPPASAGIVFDGDEGRLTEAAFLRDFAGDLPEARARVLVVGPRGSGREHVARTIHYGQGAASIGPLVPIACPLVDAEQMQNGGMQIVNMHAVFDGMHAEFVGCAVC